MNAALVDKCSVTAVKVRDFDLGRFGPLNVDAGVLAADQVVAVSIITNVAGGVPANRELAEVVKRKFLHLVFTAGVGVTHDDPGVQ